MKKIETKDFSRFIKSQRTSMFLLRIVLGAIFLSHGISKLVSGILPFAAMLQAKSVPLPIVFATLVIAIEIIGGGLLLLNTKLRFASICLGSVMIGAFFLVHINKGWFVGSGGAEFVVLLIAGLVTVLINEKSS